MGIKKYRPMTPGFRTRSILSYEELTPGKKPEKSLLRTVRKSGGRNNLGRITTYHIGGGNKVKYRIVDYRRDKAGIPAKVASVEYDPTRTSYLCLLIYKDGEKRYIPAPLGVKVGDMLMSGANAEIRPGNYLPLGSIPVGSRIHNIEMKPGAGGQISRAAGAVSQIVGREGDFVLIRLTSGEIRKFMKNCSATIGQVGKVEHGLTRLGKAGAKRWLGVKPSVRGVVMNPHDHPHGGGEGRVKGYKQPMTPWGQNCKGLKTRKEKKSSNKFIVKRRSSK